MIRVRARFWIALLPLLSMHVPALASIGIGLHLAGDDHARQEVALDLALAASHGHHHELDVAPHEHSAIRVPAPASPAPEGATLAVLPAITAGGASVGRAGRCDSPPRAGPPELFYRHCVLRS